MVHGRSVGRSRPTARRRHHSTLYSLAHTHTAWQARVQARAHVEQSRFNEYYFRCVNEEKTLLIDNFCLHFFLFIFCFTLFGFLVSVCRVCVKGTNSDKSATACMSHNLLSTIFCGHVTECDVKLSSESALERIEERKSNNKKPDTF